MSALDSIGVRRIRALRQFEAACVHDYLGMEAQAVPFYVAALKTGNLGVDHRREALLGLGSTYRTPGRYAEARQTLLQGLAEFPEARSSRYSWR